MIRRLLWRLYRVRPVSTLVLCLPGVLLVTWYGWLAFAKIHRYRAAVDHRAPLTAETYQIALHDALTTDWRRMFMPAPPEESSLPGYRLILEPGDWNTLVNSASLRDERPYVQAQVEDLRDNSIVNGRVRLRGGRHWHIGETQKSFKVKANKGELIAGNRVANLLNDPTPMVIGEQLVLDVAKELGILAPEAFFARVKVNSKDFGVYHYEAGADESLLRQSRRMPGSIFSGDLSGNEETKALWSGPELWTKVASKTDDEADKTDFEELAQLLNHLSKDTSAEFAEFAANEINLRQFALLDVLDVAFGGDQHDFRENHRYYLDPYRVQWEPIAWTFRGFKSDRHFNIVDNPVLLRLKYTPEYLTLRNRLLYDFLSDKGSPSHIHKRAEELLVRLAPELKSDPYFDAYRQLPRIDTFHRRMVRPMTLSRLALVVESELVTYNNRHAQLKTALERNPLYLQVGTSIAANARMSSVDSNVTVTGDASASAVNSRGDGAQPSVATSQRFRTPLTVVIDGEAGANLRSFNTQYTSECAAPEPMLFRNLNVEAGPLDAGWSVVPSLPARVGVALERELTLIPGVRIIPHERPDPRKGDIRAETIPQQYAFLLETSCPPTAVIAEARSTATGARVLSRTPQPETLARLPKTYPAATSVPSFTVGEVAPHRWSYPDREPREITLGPGTVEVLTTRVFDETETVTVEPGTRFRMAAGASLIFLGKARLRGQPDSPITIEPLTNAPWGGIAFQGEATAGSRLRHVIAYGGTEPKYRGVTFPAMLNIHATTDIDIEDCRFGEHPGETDLLHVAYVDDLRITDTEIRDVGGDAIDLEFSKARLKRVRLINAGDDALDLMTSVVDLRDSVLLGMTGNGISAGEESVVQVQNSLVADAKIGVQAKNASSVALSGTLLVNNTTGVRTYQRTVRYAGDSRVSANVLFVVGSKKHAVKRSDRDDDSEARLDEGRILQALPQRGVLDHVLENVLQLESWEDLDTWIASMRKEEVAWR